jgi:hypothetical protein
VVEGIAESSIIIGYDEPVENNIITPDNLTSLFNQLMSRFAMKQQNKNILIETAN